MSEEKSKLETIQPLNFRVQFILFLVTGTLWEPFYNLFCFMGLNKLDNYPKPSGVPSTKNNAVINVLLVITIIGAPYVYYKRYKLLRDYILAMDAHLNPLPKEKNKNGEEIEGQRPNVIEPLKFVGFAVTTFVLIGILVASFTIALIYLVPYSQDLSQTPTGNLWERGAFMIILLLGITTFFLALAFSVRTAAEERKWFEAFNSISREVMKENKIEPQKKKNQKQSVAD